MAKLAAKNPLTGNKMDLSLGSIGSMILGGIVLFGVVATAQNASAWVTKKANNKFVDLQPDAIQRAETKVVDASVFYG